MKQTLNLYFGLLFLLIGCAKKDMENDLDFNKYELRWELESNLVAEQPRFRARFTLINNSGQPLNTDRWELFYSQSPRNVSVVSGNAEINQIGGDFYQLKPALDSELRPGDSVNFVYEGSAWLIKETDAPLGVYFAVYNDDGSLLSTKLANYSIVPFTRPEQATRHRGENAPWPDADYRFADNKAMELLQQDEFPLIIPEPVSTRRLSGQFALNNGTTVNYQEGLKQEAEYLQNFLRDELGVVVDLKAGNSAAEGEILLSLKTVGIGGRSKNAYRAVISKTIEITGSDPAGVFYGVQSLLQLIDPAAWQQKGSELTIPALVIEDVPSLDYRGMHLDVVRHFHPMDRVKKLLDAMAFYKLNKFLFNFTEDEGWRLEIKALPELTEVGGVRGHTLDETRFLHPSYGSGPDTAGNNGTGFYTQAEFIEILQYAHQRHIEVIPEINLPGHARAAIIAMEARYRRLMEAGDQEEAERYRLADPEDQSEYYSAQAYTDNVVSVCRESTYDFFSTVLDEIINIYSQAGVPLPFIHTGGDEVPAGAWTASPMCEEFLNSSPEYNDASELQRYFFSRVIDLAAQKGLKVGGWEEVALKKEPEVAYPVNPDFAGGQVIPYVWNSLWGAQDLGYRMANSGYPVVLCNVTNLYFDLAYNRDPQEPGLYWGGFVDTRDAFMMAPFNVFVSIEDDAMGNQFDPGEDFADMVRLEPGKADHILGIQGQLWSETIQDDQMLEYYYLPKMLGLAERAWNPRPEWAAITDKVAREEAFQKAWNRFANAVGQRELHRLAYLKGGYNTRIPLPGLQIENGQLYANVRFPGLEVRYTTDGSEPDSHSKLYEGPVSVDGEVKAKTFDKAGRSSRTSKVKAGTR